MSPVHAGGNRAVTLRHGAAVRQYSKLPARASVVGVGLVILPPTHRVRIAAPHNAEGGHMARLQMVVTAAATGAPLQVVQPGC